MSKTKIALLASSIAATLVLALAAPAGTSAPSLIRNVHLNGVSGPAYYSVVDGGYRPVRMPSALAPVQSAEVAEIVQPNAAN